MLNVHRYSVFRFFAVDREPFTLYGVILSDETQGGGVRDMVEEAFDVLIQRYSRDIFRFTRAHTRDAVEAEDLTQEVFLRAYRHRDTLGDVENQKAWLLKVAVNTCCDHARKQRRHPLIYLSEPPDNLRAPGAEEEAERREDALYLMRMVLSLPVKFKDVILLHYVEDCSIAETAWLLGIPESTVKTRLYRARNHLRKIGGAAFDEATTVD